MSQDAKFEDGGERPLRLMAVDADDLQVVSSLVQDAVFPASEIQWLPSERCFAVLLNRFRWEDVPQAERRGRDFERAQAVLVVGDVVKVQSQGVQKGDPDTILSVLSLSFTPSEDGMGRLELTLAGDGAIALEVESLDVVLKDVTRPYVAPSKKAPGHPDD